MSTRITYSPSKVCPDCLDPHQTGYSITSYLEKWRDNETNEVYYLCPNCEGIFSEEEIERKEIIEEIELETLRIIHSFKLNNPGLFSKEIRVSVIQESTYEILVQMQAFIDCEITELPAQESIVHMETPATWFQMLKDSINVKFKKSIFKKIIKRKYPVKFVTLKRYYVKSEHYLPQGKNKGKLYKVELK